jgi:hypothetical protein
MPDSDLVYVYDKITGQKLGPRPRSWLRIFDHIEETPVAKARRSPKKKAAPATEPASEAADNAPEEGTS